MSDKSLWSSAVITKEPLHSKTGEQDRHMTPRFSSMRCLVVQIQDYCPREEDNKGDKANYYPSSLLKQVSLVQQNIAGKSLGIPEDSEDKSPPLLSEEGEKSGEEGLIPKGRSKGLFRAALDLFFFSWRPY